MSVKDITSKVRNVDRISNGGWNTGATQMEYTESPLRDDIRKQKKHGKKLNSKVMTYFDKAMKLSKKKRLQKANPKIQFGKWK